MRLFQNLYEKVMRWSKHPNAVYYLGFLSFIDSSLFPISPNFMLIPMSFAKPNRAFFYALITTAGSILGGVSGYLLGFFAFKAIVFPFLEFMGYMPAYQAALQAFNQWGYWAIFVGCFSPFIPYKIFTIGAGVMQLNLPWFLLASTLGRALRFFIICSVIYWGGPKVEPMLRRRFGN
jgi:membrane protein YqaA with SNARE-associated domain